MTQFVEAVPVKNWLHERQENAVMEGGFWT